MRLFIFSFLMVSVVLHAKPSKRYRYYLSAKNAEQVMANIAINPRLSSTDWVAILGSRKTQNYKVERGDNLWKISQKTLGNARLWRKLWEENPFLTNPHDVEVGQILSYYRGGDGEDDGEMGFIPLVHLTPKNMTDIDQDQVAHIDIKNRFHPTIRMINNDEVLGEISGAYSEREGLVDTDEVYIKLETEAVPNVGDRYSIVRYERKVSDSTSFFGGSLGVLARWVGDIKVLSNGENYTKVEIIGHSGIIQRGDLIVAPQKAFSMYGHYEPPEDLRARVVMGENEETKIFGEGQLILLNKGSRDGMKDGFLFKVYKDLDNNTLSTSGVDPSYKGEVQVVYVSENSSIGYIVKSRDTILVGDTVIAVQLFPPPPPVPKRETTTIYLD